VWERESLQRERNCAETLARVQFVCCFFVCVCFPPKCVRVCVYQLTLWHTCVCERVCVCFYFQVSPFHVRERDFQVSLYHVCERECERERECVCVCRVYESVGVYVCVRERV